MKPKYTIGTWIRFYSCGTMCIDQVQYIDTTVYGTVEYLTIQHGHVTEKAVLEARTKDLL